MISPCGDDVLREGSLSICRLMKFLRSQRNGLEIVDLATNGCYIGLDFWQVNVVDVCHDGVDLASVDLDRGDICSQVCNWCADGCLNDVDHFQDIIDHILDGGT
jgi:hypothetical protein